MLKWLLYGKVALNGIFIGIFSYLCDHYPCILIAIHKDSIQQYDSPMSLCSVYITTMMISIVIMMNIYRDHYEPIVIAENPGAKILFFSNFSYSLIFPSILFFLSFSYHFNKQHVTK